MTNICRCLLRPQETTAMPAINSLLTNSKTFLARNCLKVEPWKKEIMD